MCVDDVVVRDESRAYAQLGRAVFDRTSRAVSGKIRRPESSAMFTVRLVVPHICTSALDSKLCTLACIPACTNMCRIVNTLPCTLSRISVQHTHASRFATLTMRSIRGRTAFDKKIGICGRLSIRYRCVPSHLVSLPRNAVSCARNSCSTCKLSVL